MTSFPSVPVNAFRVVPNVLIVNNGNNYHNAFWYVLCLVRRKTFGRHGRGGRNGCPWCRRQSCTNYGGFLSCARVYPLFCRFGNFGVPISSAYGYNVVRHFSFFAGHFPNVYFGRAIGRAIFPKWGVFFYDVRDLLYSVHTGVDG